jgi:hypothetical protein
VLLGKESMLMLFQVLSTKVRVERRGVVGCQSKIKIKLNFENRHGNREGI